MVGASYLAHKHQRPADATPEKLVYLLVYPLEHAYTPAELGFAALKGADAAVAGVLTTAAQQARCDLHLALLTVEESGAAEYSESYGSRRGRWGRWGERRMSSRPVRSSTGHDPVELAPPRWQRVHAR